MYRNKALLGLSLLVMLGSAFGVFYLQYSLSGFLMWRGIMPQQIVLQLPINGTDSHVVLYSKSDNTGLILVGQSGKRYVEMNHEESYSSESQAVLLTASYITVMPGGVPKPSLVIGGYGLVSEGQQLELQLDHELVQPEHQLLDSDNGLLYFLHIVSDAEEIENYSIVIH